MKKNVLGVIIVLIFLVLPFGATVSAYSNLVVFGDSLSDSGNIDRFTDGSIWVETLASSLGVALEDHAYGGATTGEDNPAVGLTITGLQWQLDTFLPAAVSDETLFSVWAGANDFLQGRNYQAAVDNIGTALNTLYDSGARNILVGNLPNMGATPAMILTGNNTAASWWTTAFNNALAEELLNFQNTHNDENLFFLDAYSIFSDYTVGTSEWLNLFWDDGFHPSSSGHQLIADSAYAAVAPVPEPATIFLLGAGIIGLIGLRRKNR